MSQMSEPPFRVAICGAGIGGLTLAVTIGKHSDLPIDLYEAGSEITTVGAGISVWGRTYTVMKWLGLDEELRKNSFSSFADGEVPAIDFRKSDQPEEGFTFFTQYPPDGITSMHRAAMVDMLKRHLPTTCNIHLSKRLTGYTQDTPTGSIRLQFSDGSTAESDILIGADGVRSVTRATLFEELARKNYSSGMDYQKFIQPKWSGTLAYRCLIPTEKIEEGKLSDRVLSQTTVFCGKGKHFVSFPIFHGQMINILGYYTIPNAEGTVFPEKWVLEVSPQEVQDCYKDWEPEVVELTKHVKNVSRWAMHVVESLPFYSAGRVAILGDAAHAMTPHFGAGAGQAIEDAYILGRFLTNKQTNLENISEVLSAYQDIRLPFANKLVHDAQLTGQMYEFNAPGFYDGIDHSHERERLEELGAGIEKQFEWQWKKKFELDLERAERRINEIFA